MKVLRRVPVLRGIATTDMPTAKTKAQMNPSVSCFEAFLTAAGFRFHFVDLIEMSAVQRHIDSLL
jgi:hypothetical protein